VAGYVAALTREFSLRGLNTLDFIVWRGRPMMLEVNPRPAATSELYEPETPDGMVALHVRAFDGELPGRAIRARVRAHAIVYATRCALHIPEGQQWPHWCRDIPAAGTSIAPDEPVCSVHAEGDDLDFVNRLVNARREAVLSWLNPQPIAA
jgi:predicted ATP-grasp superfamily ATP-dependent carboligase